MLSIVEAIITAIDNPDLPKVAAISDSQAVNKIFPFDRSLGSNRTLEVFNAAAATTISAKLLLQTQTPRRQE